ncbi:MAG TPA: hypothetical protein VGF60_14825 [Xanthobacteraceae bacterium]|jgi:hypothetical protein
MLVNGPETDEEIAARIAAFRNGLQDLGWLPSTNLQFDARFGSSNDDDLREKRTSAGPKSRTAASP